MKFVRKIDTKKSSTVYSLKHLKLKKTKKKHTFLLKMVNRDCTLVDEEFWPSFKLFLFRKSAQLLLLLSVLQHSMAIKSVVTYKARGLMHSNQTAVPAVPQSTVKKASKRWRP